MSLRAVALAGAFACAACGTSRTATTLPARPVGEDLLALLPSGADLLVDVDLEQLRGWQPARRFLELLPDDARAPLERIGFDPLSDADGMVTALAGLGSAEPQATTVVRGEVKLDQARASLGAPVAEVDYRGVTLLEGPSGALAKVGPRLVAFGAPVDVRRVIDLARGEGESLREAATDRALLDAYAHAPSARRGRPAIIAAALPTPVLRERLRAEHLPGAELEWIGLSFAVGDGFDAVLVAGTRGPGEARALAGAAKDSLKQFSSTTAARLLGLRPFLDPIVVRAHENEVRIAVRMPESTVDEMLARLESVRALARPKAPPRPTEGATRP